MSDLLELDRETRTAKEPERRWKPQFIYRGLPGGSRATSECTTCGHVDHLVPGDTHCPHCMTWPSRAEAEHSGRETEIRTLRTLVFVGAIPAGAA